MNDRSRRVVARGPAPGVDDPGDGSSLLPERRRAPRWARLLVILGSVLMVGSGVTVAAEKISCAATPPRSPSS